MTSQHTAQTKTNQSTPATKAQTPSQAPATASHPMLNLQRQVGNQAATSMIQAKLTVGEPNDAYEQEADRVAAEVVRQIHAPAATAPQSQANVASTPHIQPLVQRQGGSGGMEAPAQVEAGIQQARGSGQPLPAGLRSSMEQAFQTDFSGVRVHTGGESDRLNQAIQAKAFTTGQNIFFRQGAYDPGSSGGQELIAHELTHVVQQERQVEMSTIDRKISFVGYEDMINADLGRLFAEVGLAIDKHYDTLKKTFSPSQLDDITTELREREKFIWVIRYMKENSYDYHPVDLSEIRDLIRFYKITQEYLIGDSQRGEQQEEEFIGQKDEEVIESSTSQPLEKAEEKEQPEKKQSETEQKIQETLQAEKQKYLQQLKDNYDDLKIELKWKSIADQEYDRSQQALERIFNIGINKARQDTASSVVEVGRTIVEKLSIRIFKQIEKAELQEETQLKEDEQQRRRQEFEALANEQMDFINKYLTEFDNASLALKYSKDISKAEWLLQSIIRPLQGDSDKIQLVVDEVSDVSLQEQLTGLLVNNLLAVDKLRRIKIIAKGNMNLLKKCYLFAIRVVKEDALFNQIETLSNSVEAAEKWINWSTTFLDKSISATDITALYQKLHGAGIDDSVIQEVPTNIKTELAVLAELQGMGVETLFAIFVRLANKADTQPLDAPKTVATEAKEALTLLKLQPNDQGRILTLLSYKAFMTDKVSFKLIGQRYQKDKTFLNHLLLFADYKGALPSMPRDWESAAPIIVSRFIVNGKEVLLTQGRLNYFKNRHFPSHFSFNDVKSKNTFFGRKASDVEIYNSIENVLRSNPAPFPPDNYFRIDTGGVELGVARYNGSLFVTHFQGNTGVNLSNVQLRELRQFINNV